MRYFIELAYFGKAYHGWQVQPSAISVQETLEGRLSQLFGSRVEVTGAGRTDAGVHARQLFAHFDCRERIDENLLKYKMNAMLPKDIAVREIFAVAPEAHARFDALTRSYQYHIIKRKDPFLMDRACLVKNPLDVEKMNQAADILRTYTCFKCFSKSRTDVRTYDCKITQAHWRRGNEVLIFDITADRFLRNMVRAIVGTLLEIGLGKAAVQEIHEIIKSQDRSRAGASVPAHGLYLTAITYPQTIRI